MNTKYWEHFLPDEPQNLRKVNLNSKYDESEVSRHLVMPNSWVNVLEVSRKSMYIKINKNK